VYSAGAVVAALAFVAIGVLLAVTLPYHDYDSFAFGDWSRAIAEHGKVDPLSAGPLASSRPLFYELQGALWWVTGISFTAGRLLSLAFAILLLVGVFVLARALGLSRFVSALAVVVAVSISAFAQKALSGETDVPSAAMAALAAAAAIRAPKGLRGIVLVAAAGAVAVLVKQTVLIPLVPLAVVLGIDRRRQLGRTRLRGSAAALALGLALGLAYDAVMAARFHLGFLDYLRTGKTGIWAQYAAAARTDAILRADVLGAGLRIPLLFAASYSLLRLVRVGHRHACIAGLGVALIWGIAGPLAAGVGNGPFETANTGFTFIGFAVLLAALLVVRGTAFDRRTAGLVLALALPPLVVWAATSADQVRQSAPAWPGLAILIAIVVGAAIEALAKAGVTTALAPVTVLAVAVWMSLATYDGLERAQWHEYRALGWSGVGDRARTTNIVLPAVQNALATAEPHLGGGRLVSQDPRFAFFLPGQVDTRVPLHCSDVRGEGVFVLLTADESEAGARAAGGLATPEEWTRCSSRSEERRVGKECRSRWSPYH